MVDYSNPLEQLLFTTQQDDDEEAQLLLGSNEQATEKSAFDLPDDEPPQRK